MGLNLDGALAAQRRTQAALQDVGRDLTPGVTEREVAGEVRARLVALGAVGFFHEPIVWFGPRTAWIGIPSRQAAAPGRETLREGWPVVLDVAPCFTDGVCDVSTTLFTCPSPEEEACRQLRQELRAQIPGALSAGATGRELALAVAATAERAGFESCQHHYLFGALGHRVFRSARPMRRSLLGLGLGSGVRLFGQAGLHHLVPQLAPWPFLADSPHAEVLPGDGLWSLEPHVRRGELGYKFEELLVLEGGRARWLDPE